MKRLLLGLAALVVIVLGVAFAFRGPIVMRIVAAMAEQNMAANLKTELPDGLNALVCGSGSPMTDGARNGPCLAVVAGGRVFMVDVGENSTETLARMGLRPGDVDGVLLTHFHSDHIDGLGGLSVQRWVGGSRPEPIPLYGVDGVQRIAAGFNEAYAIDNGYRIKHHGVAVAPPAGAGYAAKIFATPVAGREVVVYDAGGLKITAFRVEHEPANPAVGYRFDYKGRSLVVSGDTRPCPEVARMSKGVDLLVHEALAPKMVLMLRQAALDAHRDNVAKIMNDILDYHTPPEAAAAIAQKAGARSLLLTHIIPPLPLKAMEGPFLGDSRRIFKGPLWIAKDGDIISLPAGSKAIIRRKSRL
jgi:ribonuclease Z